MRLGLRNAVTFCCLLASAAAACAQDTAATRDAITKMKALPGSVQRVLDTINGTNFGPFRISGSCGYDSNWYCFGDCKKWNWWWEFHYEWMKSNLQGRYNQVLSQSSRFNPSFEPVKTWLTTTLPQISDKMDQAQAQLKGDVGNSGQFQAVLADLNTTLQNGANQLRSGTSQLSQFNMGLNNSLNNAVSSKAQMENMFTNDEKSMNQKLGDYPCGVDDARNQYNGIRNDVRNKFNNVMNAAQGFGVTSADTDKAVSQILGSITATQGSISGVLQNLQSAKITPAGAVQQLRLTVVASQWRELATYARQQLGN